MGGISFSQQEYDKILRVVEMMQEDFLSESKIFQNRMQEIVLESKISALRIFCLSFLMIIMVGLQKP